MKNSRYLYYKSIPSFL